MVSKAQVMALASGDAWLERAPISCCSALLAAARAICRQRSSPWSRTDVRQFLAVIINLGLVVIDVKEVFRQCAILRTTPSSSVLCAMELADYPRDQAVMYRRLAERSDDPVVKNKMLELAVHLRGGRQPYRGSSARRVAGLSESRK
jgi:hypothetical protein